MKLGTMIKKEKEIHVFVATKGNVMQVQLLCENEFSVAYPRTINDTPVFSVPAGQPICSKLGFAAGANFGSDLAEKALKMFEEASFKDAPSQTTKDRF